MVTITNQTGRTHIFPKRKNGDEVVGPFHFDAGASKAVPRWYFEELRYRPAKGDLPAEGEKGIGSLFGKPKGFAVSGASGFAPIESGGSMDSAVAAELARLRAENESAQGMTRELARLRAENAELVRARELDAKAAERKSEKKDDKKAAEKAAEGDPKPPAAT